MKAPCCWAKVPDPMVHRLHIHDQGHEGSSVGFAMMRPTCECGLPWPCKKSRRRARPTLKGMRRHHTRFRNTYLGDENDFRCVMCGKMSGDRMHQVPRGLWENILHLFGLLRE